jgi:hypothetical protein
LTGKALRVTGAPFLYLKYFRKLAFMEQRLTFITLGATDMDKLKQFYIDKFKWTPIKTDGIVFFKMNGFILALYPADELAKDAGVPYDASGFKKFTLAINYKNMFKFLKLDFLLK